jgi:acetyl esterase/lipase
MVLPAASSGWFLTSLRQEVAKTGGWLANMSCSTSITNRRYRKEQKMRAIKVRSAVLVVLLPGLVTFFCEAQKPPLPEQKWADRPVLRVWPGPASGSESDSRKESMTLAPGSNVLHVVRNVTTPTLTVFQPSGGNVTRTAVLICPGGGFRVLAIDEEGYQVADWFSQHGVTAFVLKYRLAETPPSDEEFAAASAHFNAGGPPIGGLPEDDIPKAIADGIQALKVVRQHGAQYGYAPDRVLALGFSAGGGVVTGVALSPNPSDRPNYAAPIYGALPASFIQIPKDAPPFFLAMAEDDPLVQSMVMPLFEALRSAGAKPEFHLYRKGMHGFSMKERGPSDHWVDELWWWMQSFSLTKP